MPKTGDQDKGEHNEQENTATNANDVTETGNPSTNNAVNTRSSRRKFLGQIGAALAGGAVLGKAAIASAEDSDLTLGRDIAPLNGGSDPRVRRAFGAPHRGGDQRGVHSRSASHDQRR